MKTVSNLVNCKDSETAFAQFPALQGWLLYSIYLSLWGRYCRRWLPASRKFGDKLLKKADRKYGRSTIICDIIFCFYLLKRADCFEKKMFYLRTDYIFLFLISCLSLLDFGRIGRKILRRVANIDCITAVSYANSA